MLLTMDIIKQVKVRYVLSTYKYWCPSIIFIHSKVGNKYFRHLKGKFENIY